MLAPLFLLWPMSVAITYVVAQNIADVPYDRALASHLRVLASQVHTVDGKAALDMTDPVRSMLRANETDSVFWLVLAGHGQYLGGDRELPLPKGADVAAPGAVRYEDSSLRGFAIRLAYTRVDAGGPSEMPALIIVAETAERRAQLANDIIKGVIIPQFVVLPIAVLLVWFGLSRGVAPLNALQQRLRARRPDDLSPIDERATPSEIAPLVVAINELLERLSATVQTQRRFVADAAHQLKTPLAGLRTQAELALRDASPDEMQTSLRQLVAGSERATRLVNQLLLLARAENPAIIGMAPIDLNALAREQTTLWAPQALAIGIDLGFEEAERTTAIAGNAILLAELLNNLVDNALRYTPRGGRVTVRVRALPGAAILEVEDSGLGIAPHERERVFDRFYRVLGTAAEGSGLGLAIVREIAQKHGATVTLADNPTADAPLRGLKITVRFPLGLQTET
ncbi:sensor histidine kinase [Bordetella sp. H567]|uniref:sensor histidine kinase n=1 Tax=Bordetella sp. H567 TaxID=1697043 RepID=UPI0011AB3C26|nr:sensor histidine kinase [Bordetella sp. H567]